MVDGAAPVPGDPDGEGRERRLTWQGALESGARQALCRPLGAGEVAAFARYMDLLLAWQRVHRIMGSSDPLWIARELFVDSLRFLAFLPAPTTRMLDLGSGAGFPGVPIAIVRPDLEVTLLEARQRRASFLSAVVRELGLNAKVRAERAETAVGALQHAFDAVVMRCAASPDEIMPLALRFVVPGGTVIASGPPEAKAVRIGEWRVDAGGRRFLVAQA